MLPRVIIHSGVSADGRMDWYPGDEGLYYEIAGRFNADAMLSGSNTMIAAYATGPVSEEAEEYKPPQYEPGDTRQLLVIVDSRGRLRNLGRIRREPYWRDVVLMCSQATPKDYLDYLEKQHINHIVAGYQTSLKFTNSR